MVTRTSSTEWRALLVVLKALREARRDRGQLNILVDWHVLGDGLDLFISPNAAGSSYRIEGGRFVTR
jgi:hypothetical protein